MTIVETIHIIANQLANESKKPTVALIKQHLSSPAPLPVIISALKSWSHQPEKTNIESHKSNEQTDTACNEQEIAMKAIIEASVEAAVTKATASLAQEIRELKVLIHQLSAQSTNDKG